MTFRLKKKQNEKKTTIFSLKIDTSSVRQGPAQLQVENLNNIRKNSDAATASEESRYSNYNTK